MVLEIEGAPRRGVRPFGWKRFGEGGHGLLKARCPALPLAQGRKGDAKRHMHGGAARRFDRTAFEQGDDLLGDVVQALLQHQAAYFRSCDRRRNSQRLGGELRAEDVVEASATVPVSRPALSFPNQHNTKRNRFSGSGNLALKALARANRAC